MEQPRGRDRHPLGGNERRVQLLEVLRRPKDRIIYEYDFGDGWEHDVVLEASAAAAAGTPLVRVLAGRGACPPEDVGGIGGYYYRFLQAIRDPKHLEHHEMLEWGSRFDPDEFEVEGINRYVQKDRENERTHNMALHPTGAGGSVRAGG